MIRIIVDSTCDLPSELMDKHAIIMVPLIVSLDGVQYLDKIEIQPGEVLSAMEKGVPAKTSQVDPHSLARIFDDVCAAGDDMIYIAFSSEMSCTCHSARIMAEEYSEKYPDIKIAVIDSRGGSMTTGLMAVQAAKLIEKGSEFNRVVDCINEMARHTEHIFTIADLKCLIKGGRIDIVSGTIGTLLGVKPIVHVKNGSMAVFKKVRGMDNAIAALTETVVERVRDFPEQMIGIAYTGASAAAAGLQEKITERLSSGATFLLSELGSALSIHIGRGALGVFFFNKRFSFYS